MRTDVERIIEDTEGLPPQSQVMARICITLDECISEAAGGDPARLAEVLHGLGFTKTVACLGLPVPEEESGKHWRTMGEGIDAATAARREALASTARPVL